MKNWIPVSILMTAFGASSLALAQPRPPVKVVVEPRKVAPPAHKDDHHDDHKDDHRDDHKDDHRDDHRDDHKDAPTVVVVAGDPRDHFIQQQEREREKRKEERKDAAAWAANRQRRAAEERKDINTTWGGLTSNAEARAELAAHADRMARLNRVLDLAEDRNEPTVAARAKLLIEREITRNSKAMMAIKLKVGGR
jgi:ABC-type Zn2+ transport system substrate-binding protein/surface adhesin